MGLHSGGALQPHGTGAVSLDWAVWTALLRRVGYDEFGEIRGQSLGSHMDVHFIEGLRKPSIPRRLRMP